MRIQTTVGRSHWCTRQHNTDSSAKNPSSNHVTITGQQFAWVVQEKSSKRYSTYSTVVRTWSLDQQMVRMNPLS